jgi:hypothetical protein
MHTDESSRLKGLLQSDGTGTLPTFGDFIAACAACQISKKMFSGDDDDDDKCGNIQRHSGNI